MTREPLRSHAASGALWGLLLAAIGLLGVGVLGWWLESVLATTFSLVLAPTLVPPLDRVAETGRVGTVVVVVVAWVVVGAGLGVVMGGLDRWLSPQPEDRA